MLRANLAPMGGVGVFLAAEPGDFFDTVSSPASARTSTGFKCFDLLPSADVCFVWCELGFLLMSVFIKLVEALPFISTSVSISLQKAKS